MELEHNRNRRVYPEEVLVKSFVKSLKDKLEVVSKTNLYTFDTKENRSIIVEEMNKELDEYISKGYKVYGYEDEILVEGIDEIPEGAHLYQNPRIVCKGMRDNNILDMQLVDIGLQSF